MTQMGGRRQQACTDQTQGNTKADQRDMPSSGNQARNVHQDEQNQHAIPCAGCGGEKNDRFSRMHNNASQRQNFIEPPGHDPGAAVSHGGQACAAHGLFRYGFAGARRQIAIDRLAILFRHQGIAATGCGEL